MATITPTPAYTARAYALSSARKAVGPSVTIVGSAHDAGVHVLGYDGVEYVEFIAGESFRGLRARLLDASEIAFAF